MRVHSCSKHKKVLSEQQLDVDRDIEKSPSTAMGDVLRLGRDKRASGSKPDAICADSLIFSN
jgi:hypothetical protein